MSDVDKSFDAWVTSRPPVIQDMVSDYPPDKMYRLTHTGQIGYLCSYSEGGTVTVVFPQEWNPQQLFTPGFESREVFGIDPTDLEVFPGE